MLLSLCCTWSRSISMAKDIEVFSQISIQGLARKMMYGVDPIPHQQQKYIEIYWNLAKGNQLWCVRVGTSLIKSVRSASTGLYPCMIIYEWQEIWDAKKPPVMRYIIFNCLDWNMDIGDISRTKWWICQTCLPNSHTAVRPVQTEHHILRHRRGEITGGRAVIGQIGFNGIHLGSCMSSQYLGTILSGWISAYFGTHMCWKVPEATRSTRWDQKVLNRRSSCSPPNQK